MPSAQGMRNQALGLATCALCMFLLAGALRATGSMFTESGNLLNPGADFVSLGRDACLIVRVDHGSEYNRRRRLSARAGNGGNDGDADTGETTTPRQLRARSSNSGQNNDMQCYDVYTYGFVVGNATRGEVYMTLDKVDRQARSGAATNEPCQDYQLKATPKFKNGTRTECWKPTVELSDEVHNLYQCGNPSCVKIYPPGDAKEGLLLMGTLLTYVSFGAGAIGVAAGVCAYMQYRKSMQTQQVLPQAQYGVPQQNQQGAIQLTALQQNQNWPGMTNQQNVPQRVVVVGVVQQPQPSVQTVLPGGVVAQPDQSTPYSVSGGGVQPLALQPMAVPIA